MASLDLLNYFIAGTLFEWPSSAGGKPPPLSRLSDHRDSDLSWSGDGLDSFPNLGRLGYKGGAKLSRFLPKAKAPWWCASDLGS